MTTTPTPFADWLRTYRAGALEDELTAALRTVAESVVLHEKKGTIALTLTLTEKAGGVVVAGAVLAKPPVPKSSEAFFYLTPEGSLSPRDPRQPTLPGVGDDTHTTKGTNS